MDRGGGALRGHHQGDDGREVGETRLYKDFSRSFDHFRHRGEKPGSMKSNMIERIGMSNTNHSSNPHSSHMMSQASLSRLNIRAETGNGVR